MNLAFMNLENNPRKCLVFGLQYGTNDRHFVSYLSLPVFTNIDYDDMRACRWFHGALKTIYVMAICQNVLFFSLSVFSLFMAYRWQNSGNQYYGVTQIRVR